MVSDEVGKVCVEKVLQEGVSGQRDHDEYEVVDSCPCGSKCKPTAKHHAFENKLLSVQQDISSMGFIIHCLLMIPVGAASQGLLCVHNDADLNMGKTSISGCRE